MNSATLLAIISHPAANATLARHWPYFKSTGWDILGCGSRDGKTEWPEPVPTLNTGRISVIKSVTPAIDGLLEQELDILDYFLEKTSSSDVCVVEYDGVFVRRPPPHPGGLYLVSVIPNFQPHTFRTSVYFQTPRWSDRSTTQRLAKAGRALLWQGDVEHWMSDRFMARIAYRCGIKFQQIPAWSPFPCGSPDAADRAAAFIHDARAAITLGAFYIHGVKTAEQLTALCPNGPLPNPA